MGGVGVGVGVGVRASEMEDLIQYLQCFLTLKTQNQKKKKVLSTFKTV
jgi:hypothetical protein